MAQIEESGGGGKGKRETMVELNLIPFIDLMSMAICFLLISAVWTQVSMIQIGSSIYSKSTPGPVTPPKQKEVELRLNIRDGGYIIGIGGRSLRIPKANGEYDYEGLYTQLKDIKTKFPQKTDAMIRILDHIKYDELIQGMDNLMAAGFPEIGIATQGQ